MLRFLGIGAQKCGTSWLHDRLRRHPQIGFPLGKEAHFWDRPFDDEAVAGYLAAFSDPERAEGEITPAYAFQPLETIRRIRALAPELRLIYLIRNPVERAWSSALMALARAEMRIEEASEQWFLDHFRSSGSLARGDYARCLHNWWQLFPREQLLVLRYEAIAQEPESVLRQCCAHIGVAPPEVSVLRDSARRVFAGSGEALPPGLRRQLVELYRPRVAELEDLLGSDFSAWMAT